MEWGRAGVRVNAIAPGPVDGTEGIARLASTEALRARLVASVPLGRMASLDEIAEVALFLASPAASYATGAVFVIDGGQSLGGFGTQPLG
jgi:NAD(P)-dependent dehydrogenase (short-subunit alcohol dehydrogenase family)